MNERTSVFQYLLSRHFSGDLQQMSWHTGYSVTQLAGWRDGTVIPQPQTLDYLCNCVYTPEFTIVCEFHELHELNEEMKIPYQLRQAFGEEATSSGIYAFYDSMVRLLYVGKATNLFNEVYAALRRDTEIAFPTGIPNKALPRHKVVKYLSAYAIKQFKDLARFKTVSKELNN